MSDVEIYEEDSPEEPEDVVAFCTDCLSVLPDYLAEKDLFLKAGHGHGVCKFCGGKFVLVDRNDVDRLRSKRGSGKNI